MASAPNPYEPPILAQVGDPGPASTTEVTFDGALTWAEVYAAGRLARSRVGGVFSQIVLTVVGLAALYIVWLGYYTWSEQDFTYFRVVILGGVALGVASLLIAGKKFQIWVQTRSLKQQNVGPFAPTRGKVSLERIESRGIASATLLEWPAFCGYRANEQVAVVYLRFPSPYLIFGRSKFASDADWQQLLAIFAQKLPKK
jgi:hypothetical protein